jgi:hypothetical protein
MNEKKRRAIVWDTIERIAFRPGTDRARDAWLGVYTKTLHAPWGMDSMWGRLGPDDEFIVPFLNLKCHYIIESSSKYESWFVHASSDRLYWKTHVDPGFHSKASLQTSVENYPRQQMGELRRDVEAVLNGMLFHPRCHTHLEYLGVQNVPLDQNIGGLSSYEARIGGGIENPYVFLFHLRYQLCLVSDEVRKTERLYLIDLFESSIRGGEQNVNPSDLFDFQRRGN